MIKGIVCRIYPNIEQKSKIDQTFGCCRFLWNRMLGLKMAEYEWGNSLNYNDTSAILTLFKKHPDYAFFLDADSVALQQTLKDLDRAYTNFYLGLTQFPVFKRKQDRQRSYRTMNQNNKIRIIGNHIKLPKLGLIKIKLSMNVGNIHSVTVKCTPTGKYYAVILSDFTPEIKYNNGGHIGLDVGLKEFYTDSNGRKVENPKYLEKKLRKLKREQKSLSRKVKGSKNWEKQKLKVALLHEKITNQSEHAKIIMS